MKQTPVAQVKERFGSKDKLIEAVQGLGKGGLWLERDGGRGLNLASNAKLLRLHEKLTEIKKDFASRDALIEAIAKAKKHANDKDYRNRFKSWSAPRLYDYWRAAAKKADSSL